MGTEEAIHILTEFLKVHFNTDKVEVKLTKFGYFLFFVKGEKGKAELFINKVSWRMSWKMGKTTGVLSGQI